MIGGGNGGKGGKGPKIVYFTEPITLVLHLKCMLKIDRGGGINKFLVKVCKFKIIASKIK